jgi:hypothetical protein
MPPGHLREISLIPAHGEPVLRSLGHVARYAFYLFEFADRLRMNFAVAIIGDVFDGRTRPVPIEALRLALLQRSCRNGCEGAVAIIDGPTPPVSKQRKPVLLIFPATLHHQGNADNRDSKSDVSRPGHVITSGGSIQRLVERTLWRLVCQSK